MTWGTASRKRPNAEKLERELGLMRYRNHIRLLIYEANEVAEAGNESGEGQRERLMAELASEMREDRECYPQLYRKKPKREQWKPRERA